MIQRRLTQFASGGEKLAGEIILPEGDGPFPAVLLVGGSFSDTRDGDLAGSLDGTLPKHGMLRVIAEHLAGAGIASLRWDKRGVGESTGGDRLEHSDICTDVDDTESAFLKLRRVPEVDPDRVVVLGESAGGYYACWLADRTDLPAGYILQGALYTDMIDLIALNFGRIAVYCALGPEQEAWVKQVLPSAYKMGHHWHKVMAAARRGDEIYEAGEDDLAYRMPLKRFRQEIENPPSQLFRYIQKPALVIQGDQDMNVPPGDCYQIKRALEQAGNKQVTLVVVPGADHSMQLAPQDYETRLRERISFGSFKNPYSDFYLKSLSDWVLQNI